MEQGLLEFKIVKLHRLPGDRRVKAYIDVSINDLLIIKGLRLVEGKKGLFVSMPQEQSKSNKRWYESVRCLNEHLQFVIKEKVLEAYKNDFQS